MQRRRGAEGRRGRQREGGRGDAKVHRGKERRANSVRERRSSSAVPKRKGRAARKARCTSRPQGSTREREQEGRGWGEGAPPPPTAAPSRGPPPAQGGSTDLNREKISGARGTCGEAESLRVCAASGEAGRLWPLRLYLFSAFSRFLSSLCVRMSWRDRERGREGERGGE